MDNYTKELRSAVRSRHAALLAAYEKTRGGNPFDTVLSCFDSLGTWSSTRLAVAELVNSVHPSDGRISSASRAWAALIDGACCRERLMQFGVYSGDIHSSHVEQIVDSFRRWEQLHGSEMNAYDRTVLFPVEPSTISL